MARAHSTTSGASRAWASSMRQRLVGGATDFYAASLDKRLAQARQALGG